MRLFLAALLTLLLGACGSVKELAKTEITVNAPRAEVFDAAFDVEGLKRSVPLVSNTGTRQLFELVLDDQSPQWNSIKPAAVPFAKKLKIVIELENRRDAEIRWSINDGEVKTGVTWQFEDMTEGATKVSFDLLPLEGERSEGLTLNQLELRAMARQSLDKIEAMAEKRGGRVTNG
ncbi:MAG: SRPBCC family protein [Sphingopyxis sp.]|nr:SRPBCC family protein [Sphingopyxis sp.]